VSAKGILRFGGRPGKGYVHKHGTMPTPEEAAERYAHGTPARYHLGKCRCFPCRLQTANYQTTLLQARRGPWIAQRLTARVDVPRSLDAEGNTTCRFCGATRTAWGITRHEHACASNPNRHSPVGWIVVNGKTGERHRPVFASSREAWAERDRLNKRDRPKPPNEMVSAAKVRKHLRRLQANGLGCKAISKACGVAYSSLQRLIRGMIRRTRRATEARILAVQLSESRLIGRDIPGGPTWKMIDALVAVGYRKGWIAQQLGSKTKALQMGRCNGRSVVRADKARAAKALYERLWKVNPKLRALDPRGPFTTGVADAKPAAVPLSKRDPAIAARWKALDLGAIAS
jgi:hypothetical protein